MVASLSIQGVSALAQCAFAPIWRRLVTPGNVLFFDFFSAAVVFACVVYAVRRLSDHRGEKSSWGEPVLAAFALVAVPLSVQVLTGVSLFWLALMFAAVALALLTSHGSGRTAWWRFLLSGVFAALATGEGYIGGFGAMFVLILAAWPLCRCGGGFFVTLGCWAAGFAAVLLCERVFFELPLKALLWSTGSLVGFGFVFASLTFGPLVFIVICGRRCRGNIAWGVWYVFLVLMLSFAWIRGVGRPVSACEVFARTVLNDLGSRKVIIGGSSLDFVVRAFMPTDVRLVGLQSAFDREYLLKLLDGGEERSGEALFLSDYYQRPEAKAACAELGLPPMYTSPFGIREAIQESAAKVSTELPPDLVYRVTAYTNALVSAFQPLTLSFDEMLVNFADIPPEERIEKMNAARANIRRVWSLGVGGLKLSSTVLALDMMLGDTQGTELDALTALFIDRDDPAANAVLGGMRLKGGRLAEAESYLRRSVAHGGGPMAYNNLAMTLVKSDRGAEGVTFAEKAVELKPDDWNYHETLAQTLIAAGKFEEAQRALEAMCAHIVGPEQSYRARMCLDRDCARMIEAVRAKEGDAGAERFGVWREGLEPVLKGAEKNPGA